MIPTEWFLTGILGSVAIAACWSLAVVLFRVAPAGSVARQLSYVLIAEGAALALYPPFLAVALKSKWTRPFGRKRMRIALAFAALGLTLAVQLSAWEVGTTLLYVCLILLFGFALVMSVNAWYVAEGLDRKRAGIFVLAFGLRDLCWGFVYAGSIWLVFSGVYLTTEVTPLTLSIKIIYALGTLIAVPLISYGILRAHLFDIDLKIRWTIKQSTVAAVFVAVFYIVSEGAARCRSTRKRFRRRITKAASRTRSVHCWLGCVTRSVLPRPMPRRSRVR